MSISANINQILDSLEQNNEMNVKEAEALLTTNNGNLYPLDFLAIAVLNRSMSLTSGFVTLMRLDNYISSIPLLRLQLDNYLRFAAASLVTDPHDFAMEILRGKRVDKLKTKDGDVMRDSFLVEIFSKENKWISKVYENTCGYIHLSEKHMHLTNVCLNSQERTGIFKVSDRSENVPGEFKLEAISAFTEISKLVLHIIYSWRYTKDNPPIE